jgi:hypothetical protein
MEQHRLQVLRTQLDILISSSMDPRIPSAMYASHNTSPTDPKALTDKQNITLLNVAGTYQSPAKTATHLHQAARGASGPPRLAFPNPVGDDKKRVSVGCLTGPFTTGLKGNDGQDTATGFRVSQIEANPAGFFADSHTNLFVPGVVRGQLA